MLKEASRQKAFLGASKTSDAAKNWRNTSATTRKMVTKRGAAECRSGTGVLWSFTRATRFVSKLSERSLVSTWCPSVFLALSYSSVVVSSAAYAFGRNPFLKAWVQIFAEILPKCFMMRVKKCGAHHAVEWRLLFHDLSRCDARTRAWLRRQASENVCRTVIFKLHLPLQITNLIVIFLHLWVYYFQHFLISLSFTSCLSQVCEVWVFTNRKLKRSS